LTYYIYSWHITYYIYSFDSWCESSSVYRDILDGTNRYNFISKSRYMDG